MIYSKVDLTLNLSANTRPLPSRARVSQLIFMASILSFSIAGSARAADVVKANNTDNLIAASSYTAGGPPGTADRIVINSVMGTNRTALLGGELSIDGIYLDATASKVLTIGGGNNLTLGASGIQIASGSTGGLVFNGPRIVLGADQTWDFGGRGATFNGGTAINENGQSLVIAGTTQIYFHNGTSTLGARITGNGLALTLDSAATSANLTVTNPSSTFTGGVAISTGSVLSASSMRENAADVDSAIGVGTLNLKGGTFRYTGSTASTVQSVSYDSRYINTFEVASAGQTLTLGTFNSTNSASTTPNGVVLGGVGNLVVDDNITDSTNAARTSTTLTKFGAGTLTLNKTNTYTGTTTITEGSLVLTGAAAINSSASVSVANGAVFTNNSSAAVTLAMQLAEGSVINGGGVFASTSLAISADLADGFTSFDLGSATLVKGGTLALTLSDITEGVFTLFSGGTQTGVFSAVTIGGTALASTGGGNFTGIIDGADYTFTNSSSTLQIAIPEPAAISLLTLGGMLMFGRRGRRQ